MKEITIIISGEKNVTNDKPIGKYNNQVPITAVIYAIVLILVIVCICLANQGYNVLDIIRYFIEKQ